MNARNVLLDTGDDHKDRFSMATQGSGGRKMGRLIAAKVEPVLVEVSLRGRPIAENAVGSRSDLPSDRTLGWK